MKARFKYQVYRCDHGNGDGDLVINTHQENPRWLPARMCPVCDQMIEI